MFQNQLESINDVFAEFSKLSPQAMRTKYTKYRTQLLNLAQGITELDISGAGLINPLGEMGGRLIADILENNPHITALNLQDAMVSAAGFSHIAQVINQRNITRLRSINLNGNPLKERDNNVNIRAISELSSALSRQSDLRELYLDSCQLTQPHMDAWIDGLGNKIKHLNTISLRHNKLNAEVIIRLAVSLGDNNRLINWDLGDNPAVNHPQVTESLQRCLDNNDTLYIFAPNDTLTRSSNFHHELFINRLNEAIEGAVTELRRNFTNRFAAIENRIQNNEADIEERLQGIVGGFILPRETISELGTNQLIELSNRINALDSKMQSYLTRQCKLEGEVGGLQERVQVIRTVIGEVTGSIEEIRVEIVRRIAELQESIAVGDVLNDLTPNQNAYYESFRRTIMTHYLAALSLQNDMPERIGEFVQNETQSARLLESTLLDPSLNEDTRDQMLLRITSLVVSEIEMREIARYVGKGLAETQAEAENRATNNAFRQLLTQGDNLVAATSRFGWYGTLVTFGLSQSIEQTTDQISTVDMEGLTVYQRRGEQAANLVIAGVMQGKAETLVGFDEKIRRLKALALPIVDIIEEIFKRALQDFADREDYEVNNLTFSRDEKAALTNQLAAAFLAYPEQLTSIIGSEERIEDIAHIISENLRESGQGSEETTLSIAEIALREDFVNTLLFPASLLEFSAAERIGAEERNMLAQTI